MALDGAALEEQLRLSGALQTGHFVLSSGLHSGDYVQCAKLLEEPRRARAVGEALADRLAPFQPQSVVAPALGAVIIGHEVASALRVPFRFTERQEGRMALRRGFTLARGERLAVVEDVVTTGGSTREAIAAAEAAGGRVVAVGSILNRSGAEPFAPLPFERLLDLELERYEADECRLCREGGEAVRPGSRTPG